LARDNIGSPTTRPWSHPPAGAAARFAFGENWASYARVVDEERIAEAVRCLAGLVGDTGLSQRSFLDIGCGSGLHALAASRLGAARIVAIDIDPKSVATAQALFERYAATPVPLIDCCSVFDVTPDRHGRFDVVYSWGVLHHTGRMVEALERASRLVADGGCFVFALYRRTKLCGLWRREKRWYASASPRVQALVRSIYTSLLRFRLRAGRRDFGTYVATYRGNRGMDFRHDAHDWLGGHPYESISVAEVDGIMHRLGFGRVRSATQPPGWGFFGTGCDEYVYSRRQPDAPG
jgi:SAM-dependent methyltransferase